MEEKLINELKTYLATKSPTLSKETKIIYVKEYLHAFVLDFIYNSTKYSKLNLYGGSCLRHLYGLNRLSEDLDFDALELLPLNNFESDVKNYFKSNTGYDLLETKRQEGVWGINRITLKFPILYQLGLSPIPNERVFVKTEFSGHKQHVDLGYKTVNLYGKVFNVRHFSLSTLFAGKILACLERVFQKGSEEIYIKGRDYYDLIWFMEQKIVPKEEKLLKDGKDSYTKVSAFKALSSKIETIKERDLYIDLEPLFTEPVFVKTWTENFKEMYFRLVKNYQ